MPAAVVGRRPVPLLDQDRHGRRPPGQPERLQRDGAGRFRVARREHAGRVHEPRRLRARRHQPAPRPPARHRGRARHPRRAPRGHRRQPRLREQVLLQGSPRRGDVRHPARPRALPVQRRQGGRHHGGVVQQPETGHHLRAPHAVRLLSADPHAGALQGATGGRQCRGSHQVQVHRWVLRLRPSMHLVSALCMRRQWLCVIFLVTEWATSWRSATV
uniref:Uncharacterized protein n=1 Tax=Zea mays TaxID=4577 RepID=B8A150_MAIZE|nr:unknown [Zea mays]